MMTWQSLNSSRNRVLHHASGSVRMTEWDLGTILKSAEFLDSTNVGIVLQDPQGGILECNRVAAEFFAMSIDDLTGTSFHSEEWGAVHEDSTPFAIEERPELITLKTGQTSTGTVIGFDVPTKARRWLTVNTCPAIVNNSRVGVISSFVDITSQIQREHTMRLMRAVGKFAMSTNTETELLQHLCDEMISLSDYSLAWIGEPSDSEPGVVNICFSASKNAYIYDDIVSTLASKDSGLGPTGTALRRGTTQVANDLKTQKRYKSWCTRAAEFGFSSSVAVPFYPGGRLAVLSIYDRHPIAFDEVTTSGLEEITKEIENGIAYQRSMHSVQVALQETSVAMLALEATEDSRSQSEQRFRLAFEDNMAPMAFSGLDGVVSAVNDAYCEMLGFSRSELVGHASTDFTYPDDIDITRDMHSRLSCHEVNQLRCVKRYLRKDGAIVVAEVSMSAACDEAEEILYFVSSERDITEERALSSRLSHQALHDPLTGLANRSLLDNHLAQSRARVTRKGGYIAVLMIDLDDFKGINDTYGHLVGDQLLVGIARRFEKVARPSDTLCRFGGDEFLYLADGLSTADEAEQLARRFLDSLVEPFTFGGIEFEQHATVGVVTWHAGTSESFALVQNADVALFEAKRRHKGSFICFDDTMQKLVSTRFTLSQELRHSLQLGELSMQYQPIVDLQNHHVVGFEALMRWQHPRRGTIGPQVFIPLADKSDTILELGSFALSEAVSQATCWDARANSDVRPYVSVNLAARQLHDPGLISMIEIALSDCGLAPEHLILEITESTALFDIAATLEILRHLEKLGVRIALDDFGTGYSSLSYLLQLNPAIIKIDRSFVSPEIESIHNEMLLETIITLGQKLDVTLLAEGIETEEQLQKLLRLGCKFGQGYFLSRALSAHEIPMALA
jgi:diguanylate cyclase (GGDEF)-like protein/PAS domain S-box-containing protein